MDIDLPREHHLLERAGADALNRARHRLLVVRGRHRAGHLVAPGRVGIEQRQRRFAQLWSRWAIRWLTSSKVSSGATSALTVSQVRPDSAGQRQLGHDQGPGGEAPPGRRGAPVGGEGKASERGQPEAGGPSSGSHSAWARSSRQRSDTAAKRLAPPASIASTQPSPATARPSRSGCSSTEPRLGSLPGGGHGRHRIRQPAGGGADADQDRRAASAGAAHRARHPLIQPRRRAGLEPRRVVGGPVKRHLVSRVTAGLSGRAAGPIAASGRWRLSRPRPASAGGERLPGGGLDPDRSAQVDGAQRCAGRLRGIGGGPQSDAPLVPRLHPKRVVGRDPSVDRDAHPVGEPAAGERNTMPSGVRSITASSPRSETGSGVSRSSRSRRRAASQIMAYLRSRGEMVNQDDEVVMSIEAVNFFSRRPAR